MSMSCGKEKHWNVYINKIVPSILQKIVWHLKIWIGILELRVLQQNIKMITKQSFGGNKVFITESYSF